MRENDLVRSVVRSLCTQRMYAAYAKSIDHCLERTLRSLISPDFLPVAHPQTPSTDARPPFAMLLIAGLHS